MKNHIMDQKVRLFTLITVISITNSRAPNWYLTEKTCAGDETYSVTKPSERLKEKYGGQNCTTIVGSLHLVDLPESEDLSVLKTGVKIEKCIFPHFFEN